MRLSSHYKRIFGVGPVGLIVTIVVWIVFFSIEKLLGIPAIKIDDTFRILLLIVLGADAAYLYGGGMITLLKNGWGKRLVTHGPYQYIRHPFYSALIYSATGLLALYFYSWMLLLSVVPLTFFWSWIVTKEEQYILDRFEDQYHEYMQRTGQFFPSYTFLKKEFKSSDKS